MRAVKPTFERGNGWPEHAAAFPVETSSEEIRCFGRGMDVSSEAAEPGRELRNPTRHTRLLGKPPRHRLQLALQSEQPTLLKSRYKHTDLRANLRSRPLRTPYTVKPLMRKANFVEKPRVLLPQLSARAQTEEGGGSKTTFLWQHEKLIHVAAVQTCGSSEHVCLALCSAVRHCACSALYECMNV